MTWYLQSLNDRDTPRSAGCSSTATVMTGIPYGGGGATPVAYVLSGKKLGDHGMADVLGTIPVLPAGWTDLAEIRLLGQRWVRQL